MHKPPLSTQNFLHSASPKVTRRLLLRCAGAVLVCSTSFWVDKTLPNLDAKSPAKPSRLRGRSAPPAVGDNTSGWEISVFVTSGALRDFRIFGAGVTPLLPRSKVLFVSPSLLPGIMAPGGPTAFMAAKAATAGSLMLISADAMAGSEANGAVQTHPMLPGVWRGAFARRKRCPLVSGVRILTRAPGPRDKGGGGNARGETT